MNKLTKLYLCVYYITGVSKSLPRFVSMFHSVFVLEQSPRAKFWKETIVLYLFPFQLQIRQMFLQNFVESPFCPEHATQC